MNGRFLTIDVESNGLYGETLQIAAVAFEYGKEVGRFNKRSTDSGWLDPWVVKNVLPNIKDVKVAGDGKEPTLIKEFSNFYSYFRNFTIVWHMGHVVESNLFRKMVKLGCIGVFDGPYTPIEVSTLLTVVKEPADSVDRYIEKYNIKVENNDGVHNALYDCLATYKVMEHIFKRLENKEKK